MQESQEVKIIFQNFY